MRMNLFKFFMAQSQKAFYEQLFPNCANIAKKIVFITLKFQDFEPMSLECHIYSS
jgi:hypothetical protein